MDRSNLPTPKLRRYSFTCPCGKAVMEWMAETPEIARQNYQAFAKINEACRCRECSRSLTEFQDRTLN
jgi:hypothetical protein